MLNCLSIVYFAQAYKTSTQTKDQTLRIYYLHLIALLFTCRLLLRLCLHFFVNYVLHLANSNNLILISLQAKLGNTKSMLNEIFCKSADQFNLFSISRMLILLSHRLQEGIIEMKRLSIDPQIKSTLSGYQDSYQNYVYPNQKFQAKILGIRKLTCDKYSIPFAS